jgi:hypothetical protein
MGEGESYIQSRGPLHGKDFDTMPVYVRRHADLPKPSARREQEDTRIYPNSSKSPQQSEERNVAQGPLIDHSDEEQANDDHPDDDQADEEQADDDQTDDDHPDDEQTDEEHADDDQTDDDQTDDDQTDEEQADDDQTDDEPSDVEHVISRVRRHRRPPPRLYSPDPTHGSSRTVSPTFVRGLPIRCLFLLG